MPRTDTLKVFVGNLVPDVNKPQLMRLCESLDLEPHEIIVPHNTKGGLAVAFLTFYSEQEAQQALYMLNGLEDKVCTPTKLMVHWDSTMGT